jgi:4-hydroxy-3-polyprenylbenzoate decarboxylase
VLDLERHGQLIRINDEIDPHLEMAALHRLVYRRNGPALFFENIKGSKFPAVSNLFGNLERCRFIFRSTLQTVQKLIQLKIDPLLFVRSFRSQWYTPLQGFNAFPLQIRNPKVTANEARISDLPQIQSWPNDGGAFITLPQVYSENVTFPGFKDCNLGMYRIQLGGNDYIKNEEVGLHYQLHRGIGVHHAQAIDINKKLKVSIFVGGPPAHTFAAVMPLPEKLSELLFAGILGGRRFRYSRWQGFLVSADADFCILGEISNNKIKKEGPFGDHLGYYSLKHDFPVLRVKKVFHRKNAIWPFTVVGRPPQEDTNFNLLIQEITGPIIPNEVSGLHEVNPVDEAGVHPLLLAIGSERYLPYEKREPREILTIANSILGFGQMSLAKYLFICAKEDNPNLSSKNILDFFIHILERLDWSRDLHFQTRTTIDTLDYTGESLNRGSKLVIAAAGEKKRKLQNKFNNTIVLPSPFSDPYFALPGILVLKANSYSDRNTTEKEIGLLSDQEDYWNRENGIYLIVLTDDSKFTSKTMSNFLWVTFTRSDPAQDVYGVGSFYENKHWGCRGPLIIDARKKPHHAPELEEDPDVLKRIKRFGVKGNGLSKYFD